MKGDYQPLNQSILVIAREYGEACRKAFTKRYGVDPEAADMEFPAERYAGSLWDHFVCRFEEAEASETEARVAFSQGFYSHD